MSIFRILSDNLEPNFFSADALLRGLRTLRSPSQLQMQNTEFSSWKVRADRRRGDRRKQRRAVYLDTRCARDRRNSQGRRWIDRRGERTRSGVDVYV